ncbi:hypothetical protein D3C80_1675840 [compost metagenome]
MPGQALAGRIAGQQPVAGSPQGFIGALMADALEVDVQGSARLQAHLDQWAAFEGEA